MAERHDTAGNFERMSGAAVDAAGRASLTGGAHSPRWSRMRRLMGFAGIAAALPFFVWLVLGWLGAIPSVVEVLGMTGLRVPAGITVSGLLLAAIGFHHE